MRKIREDEVDFTLTAEDEDLDPVDQFASDDVEADKVMIAEINRRAQNGDQWAWFCAKVTATLTLPDGSTIEGTDYLGGCSYRNEADFEQGPYYEDMKAQALADLQREVDASIAYGAMLAELFA